MTQIKLRAQNEPSSYTAYHNAIGATLLAALTYNYSVLPQDFDAQQYAAGHWNFTVQGEGQSYYDLRVVQMDPESQVGVALRFLYEKLATEQEDLEADTKNVLYANLWSLYA